MAEKGTTEVYVYDEDGEEFELSVHWIVSGEYVRGRYFGPPEDCYPDEYPEVEVDTVVLHEFGKAYHFSIEEVAEVYDGDLEEEINEAALETAQDNREARAERAAEDRYDRWKEDGF